MIGPRLKGGIAFWLSINIRLFPEHYGNLSSLTQQLSLPDYRVFSTFVFFVYARLHPRQKREKKDMYRRR